MTQNLAWCRHIKHESIDGDHKNNDYLMQRLKDYRQEEENLYYAGDYPNISEALPLLLQYPPILYKQGIEKFKKQILLSKDQSVKIKKQNKYNINNQHDNIETKIAQMVNRYKKTLGHKYLVRKSHQEGFQLNKSIQPMSPTQMTYGKNSYNELQKNKSPLKHLENIFSERQKRFIKDYQSHSIFDNEPQNRQQLPVEQQKMPPMQIKSIALFKKYYHFNTEQSFKKYFSNTEQSSPVKLPIIMVDRKL